MVIIAIDGSRRAGQTRHRKLAIQLPIKIDTIIKYNNTIGLVFTGGVI